CSSPAPGAGECQATCGNDWSETAMRLRLLTLIVAIAFIFSARGQSPQRLNVLLIISDDLCADLGVYGAPVKTPNIDRLAARGVKFDRVYCQYLLCGPSLSSFMSGLPPAST